MRCSILTAVPPRPPLLFPAWSHGVVLLPLAAGVRPGLCIGGPVSGEDAQEPVIGRIRSGARRGGCFGPLFAGDEGEEAFL